MQYVALKLHIIATPTLLSVYKFEKYGKIEENNSCDICNLNEVNIYWITILLHLTLNILSKIYNGDTNEYTKFHILVI